MLSLKIEKKLADFSLDMELETDEKLIGVLGSSGSGKSMLLKCIAGLVKPDKGRIQIENDVFYDSQNRIDQPIRKRKVGFLFQNYALFPNMTVLENIQFGVEGEKDQQKKAARELIEKYYLTEIESRYPDQISGGQQQRVALARAIASKPEIMLLDEPFSALDVDLRNRMIHEMQTFLHDFEGRVLFVTHNMEEAYQLTDQIAVVKSGRIESFQDKHKLFHKPESMSTARLTGCKNLAPARRIGKNKVFVEQWGIELELSESISKETGYLGMRANQIRIIENGQQDQSQTNVFKVWMVDEAETFFKTSVFVKIDGIDLEEKDYHLHCIMVPDERLKIKSRNEPFYIQLPQEKLFFMEKE